MTVGLPLAMLAAALWTLINVFDKAMIERFIRHPLALTFILIVLDLPVGLILFALNPARFTGLELAQTSLAMLFGVVANILYFVALKKDQVSRVIPLFALGPLFTAIAGYLFLDERFRPLAYLGIGLVLVSAWTIQIRGSWTSPLRSPALGIMVLTALLWAAEQIMLKPLLDSHGTLPVIAWALVTAGVIGVIGSIHYAPLLRAAIIPRGRRLLTALAGFEGLNILTYFVYFAAVTAWQASLASAASSMQYLMVFLLVRGLSPRFPEIYREEVGRRVTLQKIFAILGMIAGVAFLTQA